MLQNISVFNDKSSLVAAASARIVECIELAVHRYGRCVIALAGGSTPREVYERLARPLYANRIPWDRVFLFWGDERMVAPDHIDSNFHMTNETLLWHIDIPADNVFRVQTGMEPEEAAAEYAGQLQEVFAGGEIHFDLTLLGMGSDGHTASLFPGTAAVDIGDRLVAAVEVPQSDSWRISLTLPVINQSREIMVLVSGESKAGMVATVNALGKGNAQYPVSLLAPEKGRISWLMDKAAASEMAIDK